MAVSEDATTWMSSTAMNMPRHMAAKPSQSAKGFKPVAPNASPPNSPSAQVPPDRQPGLFLANAPEEHRRIGKRKENRHADFAEGQRQHQYLSRHHEIIGVADETIGPALDQRHTRQGDDARRPIRPQACDHPDAGGLQHDKDDEPNPMNDQGHRQQ